ncbi:MAG: O-antigen ligase family protein [Chloroflexi bacterium]|nr:O-antigen ligase family protein [Chloroflexota bacterium]MBP8058557.1 O-antigen ligase family protein [Chloroflexota bacterium]
MKPSSRFRVQVKGSWGYAAAFLLPLLLVLLTPWLKYTTIVGGLVLLAALLLGVWLFWRWPELGVFLLLALLAFGNEYSQTEWGVRSADQLATIYNRRLIPGVIASVFDLIFVAVLALWLGRKWLKREPFVRLPTRLILPVALCLAFVGYGTILGLFHLRDGFELYYILREVRPFVYLLLLLWLTVDVMTGRGRVDLLWWVIVLLAAARGVQGVARYGLGIGRWYYGSLMIYYDYSDTLLLLAGMALILTWLLGQRRWPWSTLALSGAALLPMAFAVIFSFRRSFWLGAAAGLGLLFFYTNNRERSRYLFLALVGGVGLLALVLATGQLDLIGQRLASITDTQDDPSNYFRLFDTANALNAIYESGTLGLGFGSRYEVVASVYWLDEFITHVSRASHNGYLYVTMKMGLLGLFSWTFFWLMALSYCFTLLGRGRGRVRHIGLGVSVILITCALANTFLPLYYNLRPLLLLAIFTGLAIAASQLPPDTSEQE